MPDPFLVQVWRGIQMRKEARDEVLSLARTYGEGVYDKLRERLSQPQLRTRYRELLRKAAARLPPSPREAARALARRISVGEVTGGFTEDDIQKKGWADRNTPAASSGCCRSWSTPDGSGAA